LALLILGERAFFIVSLMTALIASILSIVTMGAQVFSNYQVAVRRWLSYNKYKYLNIASSPVTFVVWCALISSTTIIVLYNISMQPVIFTARRITFMYLWMACLLSIARGRNAWMVKS